MEETVLMKKILFVINTMGTAGAEKALIELLSHIDPSKYECCLLVLMNQGQLIKDIPDYVRILNKNYDYCDILSKEGKRHIIRHTFFTMFKHAAVFKFFLYIVREWIYMKKQGNVLYDKLMWQVMACGAPRIKEKFDLAVAFHEGGSSYYVANYVKADKKVSFIHISYTDAGYRKSLDRNAYSLIDRIYGVSDEVKDAFLQVYPELSNKVGVFHNMIDPDKILKKGELGSGFTDDFDGIRILSVGRLHRQKTYELAIAATKCLIERGKKVRWYILGEGEERDFLTSEIKRLAVEDAVVLVGDVDNPFPYYKNCDIYAHASRFEGKALAIQEAQIFKKPIIATDCNGNREQIVQEYDGILCEPDANVIADCIERMIDDRQTATLYGNRAYEKIINQLKNENELDKLLNLME